MNFIELFSNWWGIVLLIVISGGYVINNTKNAKELAYKMMLIAEKRAEELVLKTGLEKKEWVLSQYDLLPAQVKMFVTRALWEKLVQDLYDKALDWAETNKK